MEGSEINNRFLNRINKKFLKTTVRLFSIYLLMVSLLPFLSRNRIKHDFVSWALPAQALINNQGIPYVNYWDIKAPGLIMLAQSWIFLFGNSYFSFLSLHLMLIVLSIFGIVRIFYTIFDKWTASWLSLSSAIIFLSPLIQTQFAGAELSGLALCVVALNLVIPFSQISYFKMFLSSFLFVLSSQMKEPYSFTALSLIPLLIYYYSQNINKFKNYFLTYIIGGSFAVLNVIVYLMYYGSFEAYKEVLAYKKEMFLHFSISEVFNHFVYSINYSSKTLFESNLTFTSWFILLVLVLIFTNKQNIKKLFRKYTKKGQFLIRNFLKQNLNKQSVEQLALLVFSLATFLGIALQFRYSSHYVIPVIFSTIIIFALSLKVLLNIVLKNQNSKSKKKMWIYLLYAVLLIMTTFPKTNLLTSFSLNIENLTLLNNFKYKNVNETLFPEEKKIIEKTDKSECIISVYGWAVGSTYFYTNRKPCTRYFLLQAMPEKYGYEYSNSLIENIPSAIIYTRENADFNIELFEDTIFNYSSVISKCYSPDNEHGNLFFPKYNKDKMRKCIQNNYN
jgi:hypothetical protein